MFHTFNDKNTQKNIIRIISNRSRNKKKIYSISKRENHCDLLADYFCMNFLILK